MSARGHVVGPEGVRSFESPAREPVVVRATGEESGGYYDLLELTVPPGPGVTPTHLHRESDEAVLVLEGTLALRLGEEDHHLGPGAYAMAPRGLPHTYRNAGEETARVLFTHTPGNNWRYLEAAAAAGPVEDEADLERLAPLLEEHGVELVGPPLSGARDGGSR